MDLSLKYELFKLIEKLEDLQDLEERLDFLSERIHSLEHITEKILERLDKIKE